MTFTTTWVRRRSRLPNAGSVRLCRPRRLSRRRVHPQRSGDLRPQEVGPGLIGIYGGTIDVLRSSASNLRDDCCAPTPAAPCCAWRPPTGNPVRRWATWNDSASRDRIRSCA